MIPALADSPSFGQVTTIGRERNKITELGELGPLAHSASTSVGLGAIRTKNQLIQFCSTVKAIDSRGPYNYEAQHFT